ncbi:hypothetical protein D7X74_31650 [Corallococcus sp. CA047B]|nr:hypothetical protein D7X74_31650 [Corallococcus sp. CA047B]
MAARLLSSGTREVRCRGAATRPETAKVRHPTAAEEFVTLRDKRTAPSESVTRLELGREIEAPFPGEPRG